MKQYEPKFRMIRSLLEKEDPVVVEIGAHYGEDSLRFLETFKNIRLFCFEPDKRNINIFKKHVADPRVELFEVALSNVKGTAPFYPSYQECTTEKVPTKYDWISPEDYLNEDLNSSGASSLKRGYMHTLPAVWEVNTDRFDNWYDENALDKIDFVWIDVQGAEKEVIEGMGTAITNVKYIWMEYGEEFYEGGMSRGETLSLMQGRNFGEVVTYSAQTPQGDILFRNLGW